MNALRLYAPDELGRDGYPPEWHRGCLVQDGELIAPPAGAAIPPQLEIGIKHYVRDQAGNRCVRCLHPYNGPGDNAGEWSPCDERCTHQGPGRYRPGWSDLGEGAGGYENIDPWAGDTATPSDALAGQLVEDGIDVEARWRILTVHHLTGCWGREGTAKGDCRWWNLVACCQRCHLYLQRKVDMHRVWPWEHSEWMKPYAAGFYAATYLGENLTRREVMARLDELLALERAA